VKALSVRYPIDLSVAEMECIRAALGERFARLVESDERAAAFAWALGVSFEDQIRSLVSMSDIYDHAEGPT
jgi:hypothetical protein